jgi:hypothetical protein
VARRKRLTLLAAIMGSFVAGLDATAVNVALPAIPADLRLPAAGWSSTGPARARPPASRAAVADGGIDQRNRGTSTARRSLDAERCALPAAGGFHAGSPRSM